MSILLSLLAFLVGTGLLFSAIVFFEKRDVAKGVKTYEECHFIEKVEE